jgi:hypothetical protein
MAVLSHEAGFNQRFPRDSRDVAKLQAAIGNTDAANTLLKRFMDIV